MGLEAVVVVDVVFVVLVVCQLQDLESSFFRNTGIEQVYTTYYPKPKSKKQKKKSKFEKQVANVVALEGEVWWGYILLVELCLRKKRQSKRKIVTLKISKFVSFELLGLRIELKLKLFSL